MDFVDHFPLADYPLEEEDHMTGYETILFPSPRNSSHFDLGTPLGGPHGPPKTRGSSVVVNNAARQNYGDFRKRNTWNANPRSGVIIQHLSSIPPDAERPRIVEVTGMDDLDEEDGDGRGISNPDYPVSEPDTNGGNTEYPTLPADAGPPLPDRDYNSDSRPDIHRVNLSAGDNGDPPGVTVIPPPAPPPPPPVPQVQTSEQTPAQQSQGNTTEPSPGNLEMEVPPNQELHIVLRRALARNFDTTQPTRDEPDRSQGEGTERASRESYTQTRPGEQQSTEVQTTLDRPQPRDNNNNGERQSDNRNDASRSGQGSDQRSQSHPKNSNSEHRRSTQNRESYSEGPYGPRFQSEAFHPSDNTQPSQRPQSGVDSGGYPLRSSRIIERIIITREIDPATGQPMDSVPMQNFDERQRPRRPRSDIAYNDSVRDSGRRSRGWAPFRESNRNWSPRDGNEHLDLTGIVAGMETETDGGNRYSYMPRERTERRGRTNQGYNVSPPEDRRRPDVVRMSSSQPAWGPGDGRNVPPPPPYTERDVPPPQLRSSLSVERSAGHGWGRSGRPGSWPAADSDGSSTIAAGWTQRTRVVFAVMLLLCIILLLALVVVVSVYFTAGPGKDCINDGVCQSPSVGYIVAFGVIGFLAFTFMIIGVILCCVACRITREKRIQNYPVSRRR